MFSSIGIQHPHPSKGFLVGDDVVRNNNSGRKLGKGEEKKRESEKEKRESETAGFPQKKFIEALPQNQFFFLGGD
jgi:hypothetical protein